MNLNLTLDNDLAHCGEQWTNSWTPFNSISDTLVQTICAVGIITNAVNLMVFTRWKMQSPTNSILTVLAITHLIFVLRPIVKLVVDFCRSFDAFGDGPSTVQENIETLLSDVTLVLFHTWSVYLTLVLAMWRFICVVHPLRSRSWCTDETARYGILSAIFMGCLIVPPMYTGISFPDPNYFADENPYVEIKLDVNPYFNLPQTQFGQKLQYWIQTILIKLLPCVTMTILTVSPILSKSGARRKDLNASSSSSSSDLKSSKDFHGVSQMLLVILLLFLFTELPYSVFGLVDIVYLILLDGRRTFYFQCLRPIEPLFELFEYLSCACCFFIYITMSRNFRASLIEMGQHFCKKFNKLPIPTKLCCSSHKSNPKLQRKNRQRITNLSSSMATMSTFIMSTSDSRA